MTEKEDTKEEAKEEAEERRGRPASGRAIFPRDPLKRALQLAQSIERNNAGRPYDRLTLAGSINFSPNSSGFRTLIISSGRYGLTEGGYTADKIALTPLGSQIVAPTSEDQVTRGLRQALLTPDLLRRVYDFYNKKAIPREDLFKNALKKEFNVAPEDVDSCYEILTANMRDYNLIQDIKGNEYLQLDRLAESTTGAIPTQEETQQLAPLNEEKPQAPEQLALLPPTPKQIFVAHGRNKRPLEQLEKILNRFKVPYRVAEEEAHRGRPIGTKVAELMKQCTSGIFIFTADEETTDAEGNKSYRPSDNVVFELGAASIQYGEKIVILKEEAVKFASDFGDIGYISFEKDKLDAKAADLMVELIGLGFLQVTPT
ncbi:MAG: nucleotide-binding protein [Nitrososphaerota archaeon]|nr:nucleotide-binding protein [Nitrososphaerota archaeon]